MVRSLSSSQLATALQGDTAPLVLDVRRAATFASAADLVAGARWRDPADVAVWCRDLPAGRMVVAYCVHGHEVSRNVAAALQTRGFDAAFLEGGIEAWRESGGPLASRNMGATP